MYYDASISEANACLILQSQYISNKVCNFLTFGTDAATGPMYARIRGSSMENRLEELSNSGMSSAAK